MKLDLNSLPDYPVHVSGFGGWDAGGVLELDAMAQADAVFGYRRFILMLQTYVSVVFLDPGFSGTASLSTLAGYAVHAYSLGSQVV
jgi:hypothetical protein